MAVREGKPLGTGYFGRDCMVLPTGDVRTVINCGVDQILCGTNVTRRRINEAVRARDGRTTWYPEPGERLVCLVNQHQQGLLNGSVWIARGTAFGRSRYSKEPLIRVDVEPEDGGGLPQQIVVPIASFDKCFDYAYALTVHKAQGSQWDNVVLIDESWVLERVCGIATVRWLYTGITRAAKQLTVIKRLARVPQ